MGMSGCEEKKKGHSVNVCVSVECMSVCMQKSTCLFTCLCWVGKVHLLIGLIMQREHHEDC